MFDAAFWTGPGATIATSIITSSIVAGVAQVILKARYDARLARQVAALGAENNASLERLKAELSAENARELEQTRGEAAREAERFKQRFAFLATRQAEAAIELAERLAKLDLAARRLTQPVSFYDKAGPNELIREADQALWSAREFIDARRLLFPSDIGVLADSIIQRASEAQAAVYTAPFPDRRTPEEWKMVKDAWANMVGPGAAAMKEMTDKLRDLLQGEMG